MKGKKYFLVAADIVPDVFLRVLQAKQLLASGEAKNVSRAAKMAGVSRSAFYKYKDYIFEAENMGSDITLTATLLDETGALQTLLAGISQAGGSVVTINQNMPEHGAAVVAVTVRTADLRGSVGELCEELKLQHAVVDIKRSK